MAHLVLLRRLLPRLLVLYKLPLFVGRLTTRSPAAEAATEVRLVGSLGGRVFKERQLET